MKSTVCAVLGLLAAGQSLELRLAAVGRDAVFVEPASVVAEGDRRTFRALRIVAGGEPIAGELYYGGWQRAAIDCRKRTFHDLSFQSLRESGAVGPDRPSNEAPYPIVRGSVEDGLADAVCRRRYLNRDAPASVAEAARLGRLRIEENTQTLLRRGRG